MTSRCQGLFPPHPFFKGKALGTRLGKEKREALSLFPSCPARFLFFDYCYCYWDTQRELLRRRELNSQSSLVSTWLFTGRFQSSLLGFRNTCSLTTENDTDFLKVLRFSFPVPVVGPSAQLSRSLCHTENKKIGTFIRGKLRRVLNKKRTVPSV